MDETNLKDNLSFDVDEKLASLELDKSKVVKIRPFVIEEWSSILRKYIDVFAWCPTDLTCVSPQLLTHKLNIPNNIKPVQQKKKKVCPR